MKEVDYVQKEKKTGMKFAIVTHDAVTAKVREAFIQHGIVHYPCALEASSKPVPLSGNRQGLLTEVKLTVRFANADDPADFIDVPSLGHGLDDADKGPGKGISYAVKYAVLKALSLETGLDPDEDQETRIAQAAPPPQPAQPQPAREDRRQVKGVSQATWNADQLIGQARAILRDIPAMGADRVEAARKWFREAPPGAGHGRWGLLGQHAQELRDQLNAAFVARTAELAGGASAPEGEVMETARKMHREVQRMSIASLRDLETWLDAKMTGGKVYDHILAKDDGLACDLELRIEDRKRELGIA